jgi:plastocyanin
MVGNDPWSFSPASVSIQRGAKVTFTNQTQADHTVTANGGAFNFDPVVPGQSVSFTFSAPGTYSYYCQFHTYMTGTITVS